MGKWEQCEYCKENKVVGTMESKEGTTVGILTGTNYKSTVLKFCGEYKLQHSLHDQNLTKE